MEFKIGNISINTSVQSENIIKLITPVLEVNNLHDFIKEQPVYPEWREEIQKMEFTRAIHGTLALESSDITLAEVQKVVEAPETVELTSDKDKEARNILKTYEFITEWTSDNPNGVISESVIKQLHTIITRDINYYLNEPGQYRKQLVTFGDPRKASELKNLFEIEAAMTELIKFISSEDKPLSIASFPATKAIMAHYLITLIHPFIDGNGRVARAVEALILHRYGRYEPYCFPINAKFYYQERKKYFELLRFTDSTGDIFPFLLFALKGLLEHLTFIKNNLLDQITRTLIIDYMHQLRRQKKLLKRQVNLMEIAFHLNPMDLNDFLKHPAIKGIFHNVSESTRKRDIRHLSNIGLLSTVKQQAGDGKEITIISANWDVLKSVTLRLDKIPHRPIS